MADQTEEILLLTENQIRPLASRSMQAGFFGKTLEDGLQYILQNFPQLIPGNQINPADPPKFVLLRREMPLGSWSLDHLFVDDKGILTLVETKLMQNPESRREVIGQIIEYGAYASERWEISQLRQDASEYWQGQGVELDAILLGAFGEDLDLEGFWSIVEQNLHQGRFRLIIAADELRAEVRRMIEFLNREMRNVEVLGLEWKFYGEEQQALVIVPRLIGQTQSFIDRRASGTVPAGKTILWTVEKLNQAVEEIENVRLRENYKRILVWAVENGCFLESRTIFPTFGLRGSKGQIASIFVQYDAIYLYMKENKYAG
ncbi:MAG: hypothetical protein K6T55_02665, partial [Syntrophobacterales bacterium]|nr:hypothetical protein [Syntrophobacterales bacterium]